MTTAAQNTSGGTRLLTSADVKRLAAGETFKGVFVVNSLNRKTDKNGRYYWDLTVSDQLGAVSGKVWGDAGWLDRSTAEMESKPGILSDGEIFALKGKSVGITGKTSDFRGQVQFSFSAISLLNQDRFSPTKYMASSDVPVQILEERFASLISSCRGEIRELLEKLFEGERGKAFRDLPAAVTNHHAYSHGLLEHTVTTAEAARVLALAYKKTYPDIDVDIVTAGALLHDIGKIGSYTMSPVPEVTLDGAVLDHIALGYAIFVRVADETSLSDATKRHLAHILLSHHGQKEYGSPVLPATPEALIVSSADELDFRLFCWKDSMKDMAEGQSISAFHFSTQRRFWRAEHDEPKNGVDDVE